MEDFKINVLESIEDSAKECLPVSVGAKRMSGRKVVFGWLEHMRPYAVWQFLGISQHFTKLVEFFGINMSKC